MQAEMKHLASKVKTMKASNEEAEAKAAATAAAAASSAREVVRLRLVEAELKNSKKAAKDFRAKVSRGDTCVCCVAGRVLRPRRLFCAAMRAWLVF